MKQRVFDYNTIDWMQIACLELKVNREGGDCVV